MRGLRTRSLAVVAVGALAVALVPAAFAYGNSEPAEDAACQFDAWSADEAYVGGDAVSHDNEEFEAQWWTQGDEPGTTGEWGAWTSLGPCENDDEPTDDPPPPSDYYNIGYFTNWGVYERDYHVKDIVDSGSAEHLTHIMYAFGNVQGGECTIGDSNADYERHYSAEDSVDGEEDSWDPGALRGNFNQLLKLKEAYPHIQVVWSFGGWTWSGGFDEAAENPEHFAQSCYDLVNDSRWADVFDGIDIDWEYPGACGEECSDAPYDAYPNLMSALRDEFGSDLVTAAIPADPRDDEKLDTADYGAAAEFVDFYMAMTYDYFGTWDAEGPTAPHSPLSCYEDMPIDQFCAEETIDKLRSLGISDDKVLLGLGFYGRGWDGVEQEEPGGSATGPASGTYEDGIEDYHVLIEQCPPTGQIAGTSYGFCDGQWWNYDSPDDMEDKASWAINEGLQGVFFWELSGDRDGELISALGDGLGD